MAVRGGGRSVLVGVVAAALCGVGAELLSGYGPSTGHLDQVVVAVVFFAALYGAPALLAREVARRRRWGWPSLLSLMAALGVAQCCVIDQSLFSADYQGYDGWQQARELTWVPWLGTSAYNAANFVLGHLIFSFAAPIAVAEAWRPALAHRKWLNGWGIGAALVAYLTSAAMILGDPQSRSASPTQLLVSVGVIAALLGVAAGLRGRGLAVTDTGRRPPGVAVVVVVAAGFGVVVECVPPTWWGVSVYLTAAAVGAGLLWWASTSTVWTWRHGAAVGVGLLLARGLLAIVGDPVGGDVVAVAKYTHNAVMLAVVAAAGWYALHSVRTSTKVGQ